MPTQCITRYPWVAVILKIHVPFKLMLEASDESWWCGVAERQRLHSDSKHEEDQRSVYYKLLLQCVADCSSNAYAPACDYVSKKIRTSGLANVVKVLLVYVKGIIITLHPIPVCYTCKPMHCKISIIRKNVGVCSSRVAFVSSMYGNMPSSNSQSQFMERASLTAFCAWPRDVHQACARSSSCYPFEMRAAVA
jgi:hypothetical protein